LKRRPDNSAKICSSYVKHCMLNYRMVHVLVLHEFFFITTHGINNVKVITAGGWIETELLNANLHKKRARAAASQNHMLINISLSALHQSCSKTPCTYRKPSTTHNSNRILNKAHTVLYIQTNAHLHQADADIKTIRDGVI
jgi:hypothetical protein